MDTSQENGLPAEPSRAGRIALRIFLFVAAVLLMGNLGAIVDALLHPEIEYFDEEHIIVGGAAAFMTSILLGALSLYILRQEKITRAHKLAELVAVEEEKKYREIFEESRDAIFVAGPDGRFEELNPAAVDMFGYSSREEMLHVNTSDIYPNEGDREALNYLIREKGSIHDHEITLQRKDGSSIDALLSAQVVYDDGGEPVLFRGTVRDITAQKRMEQQLLQSQKMESVGRLAGGVAHDFNNYLTAIQGYIDLVLKDLPAGSPQLDDLLEARKATTAASGITSQLLMFGRHNSMEVRPVDLNRIVEGMNLVLPRLVEDNVRIVSNLSDDLHMIMGDTANLGQAVVNLVLNSAAYMPMGGEITITTCNGNVNGSYAEAHPEARTGEFATISVSDTGSGISAAEMPHVFEPFYRHDDRTGDAGMGLSVVYGVIIQHDGWIDVDSIPGMGTTFTIFLPAVNNVQAYVEPESTDAVYARSNGERILLVEDDDAVREITGKMLRDSGYEVVGAHDAAEAFARFASEKGDFQLVFSDVVLPGENGVALVDNLRSHKPELAVLLASGYADTTVDWNTVQARGYRFMQKPYVMPELLKTIRELLVNTS